MNVDKIKVSIVIPVYNVETYLKQCLDSVINQTLREIEIICINDGSTDKSLSILEEYANADNMIIKSISNSGLSVARNCGMQLARGEYIYFLDSDDYLELNAMEHLYNESKKKDLDILYFDANVFYDGETLREEYISKGEYKGVYSGIDFFNKSVEARDYRSSACLQFIKKSYWEKIGIFFDEGLLYEDNWFTFQLMVSANRTAFLKECLYNRRVRKGSIMTNKNVGFLNFYSLLYCYKKMWRTYWKIPNAEHIEESFCWLINIVQTQMKRFYDSINRENLSTQDIEVITNKKKIDSILINHLGFSFELKQQYFFDSNILENGSKIILYGAGKVGQDYCEQLQHEQEIEIVLWLDKKGDNSKIISGLPIVSVREIYNKEYDYIVIAVNNEQVAKEIRKELLDLGIAEEKIVWKVPELKYVVST